MTNDKELLTPAAKAAGIKALLAPDGILRDCTGRHEAQNIFSAPSWNPLTDDGDALRLAVKLELEICFNNQEEGTTVWCPAIGDWIPERHNDDPYAATRRAIVRAAAEIGKDMK